MTLFHKRDHDAALSLPDGTLTRDQYGSGGMAPMIERLENERADVASFIDRTVAEAETAGRDLSDTERASLQSSRERVQAIDDQLTPLREFAELTSAHRSTGTRYAGTRTEERETGTLGARTNPRQHEYRTAGEFMADVATATARPDSIDSMRRDAARGRLQSHGLTAEAGSALSRATQTTADTPGILPENIVGQVEKAVDAARPFMTSVGIRPLGGIPGKTFHRPTVTQSTQVGEQTGGEKTELPSRKMVIGDVDFTKRTFGGWVNISRQDIDWTSPSAWDAVLTDLQEQYAIETEEAAAGDFVTAVAANGQAPIELAAGMDTLTVRQLFAALFAGAAASYGVAKRLPDRIWASLDMWAAVGPVLAEIRANGSGLGAGDASMQSFVGNLGNMTETVVPSFPAGTLIMGPASKAEVYEERIGLLSVIEPKILGVEVAYGGYMANGLMRAGAFQRVTLNTP